MRKGSEQGTRTNRIVVVLVAPAILVLLAFTYVPIVRGILLSTTDSNLVRPGAGDSVGLQNFTDALSSARFWTIAWQTALWTVLSTLGATILGVAGAVVAFKGVRGKSLLRGLLLLPWLAPPVASAFIWRYLYAETGPINGPVVEYGWLDQPIGFLNDASSGFLGISLPLWSVIQVGVWSGFGFIFLFTLAAMSGIPEDLYEAARLDGANAWRRFKDITLPLIAPVLEMSVLLMVLYRLAGFDLPFLLTHGGPADATNVLGVYIYDVGFGSFRLGESAALGALLLVVAIPLGAWYVRRAARVAAA